MKNTMHYRLAFSIAAALVFSLSALAADGENIIPNGSFEDWEPAPADYSSRKKATQFERPQLLDDLVPLRFGLLAQGSGSTISRDAENKVHGDYAIRIQHNETSQAGIIVTKEIPVEPLSRYEITVWYKMEGVEGGTVGLWARFGPAHDFWERASNKRWTFEPNKGTSDWQKQVFKVNSGEDSATGAFSLDLREATGTVWFDDFSVVRIGDAVPTPETPEF